MGNAGPQNAEDTVGSLMDGVLLLANANQELNYRRRELMRPQLNANYRHLCSPSNPVTSLLFGDDLPKAVENIRHYQAKLQAYQRQQFHSPCQ